ncbi:MAG: DUF4388 domain-containing protein [Candidatus Sericytochromatia bacterium]|nr:DUF4388 domain-containing protein [Candidatus Sericytochromatia bacterium]
MSKIILSGDLSRFRPEMLVRILESIRADVIVTLEGNTTGQITVLQGKVVGAAHPPNKGMDALKEMVTWNSGTFTIRDISGTQTSSMVRSPDIMNFPDNASIFRAMMSLRRPVAAGGAAAPPPPGRPAGGATGPVRPGAAPGLNQRTTQAGPKIGPLAKVPHLTDKGRTTVKSLQANFARGVNVEGDKWRVLLKCSGEANLYQVGEEANLLGDRLINAAKELEYEGLITFDTIDQQSAQKLTGNFKFGEYMIAKGHITQVQLEAALQRQQELARKGRYLWLGEILVEMNYVRPSQVQEALAYQKRSKK